MAGTLVVAGYVVLGLLAHWPLFPGDPTRVYLSCDCGDMAQTVWFMAWTPHAILTGHNPLFTHAMNYPVGVNLAQNTLMPLLGLLAAPITATLGPVATANFWMVLAMPLSATSAYLVLRHWRLRVPAAALGGLLFGFSPYLVGQGVGHLDLTFVALVPLIVLAIVELAGMPAHPVRLGALLALVVVAQFFVSPEVLVTVLILSAVGVVAAGIRLAVSDRAALTRRIVPMALGLGVAVVVVGAVLAYPAWFELAGPHHFVGPAQGPHNIYRADLADFVVPSPFQWLAPGGLRAWGVRLTHLVGIEDGAYLGVPVLLLAVWIAWRSRGAVRTQVVVVVGLAAAILSLGPHLVVDGHATGVPLPFLLLSHLPGISSILPIRISFETDAALAALLAFAVDDQWRRAEARGPRRRHAPAGGRRGRGQGELGPDRRRSRGRAGWSGPGRAGWSGPGRAGWRGTARQGTAWLFTAAVLAVTGITLAPRWPDASAPATTAPAALAHLPAGTVRSAGSVHSTDSTGARAPVVLTYPLAVYPEDQALAWQAGSDFRFDLIGSYALVPHPPTGTATAYPSVLRPPDVEAFLGTMERAQLYRYAVAPPLDATLIHDTTVFLHRYAVAVVAVDRRTRNAGPVARLFTLAIGRPPHRVGRLDVWKVDFPASPRRAAARGTG